MSGPGPELYPDPIAEELPKRRLPRWLWIAAVPIVLVALSVVGVVGFGVYAVFALIHDTAQHDRTGSQHRSVRGPNAADRAALLTVRDLPPGLGLEPELGTFRRVHHAGGRMCVEYAYDDGETYVYSSLSEAGLGVYHVGTSDCEPAHELFRWGDRSSVYVDLGADGRPRGYTFLGERGTRRVRAQWGGRAYEPLSPEAFAAFLGPIVERMAGHELEP